MRKFYLRYENCIWTLLMVIVNAALMGSVFDFYFDLNDDTMMNDIMSGIYSGTPDGHNMQTLYILGAFIGFGYRLCRAVPWYGLFLCSCQFFCCYLVGVRLTGLLLSRRAKAGALFLVSLFQWSIALSHFVNIQYTVTCAMMSAAAIFWFATTPKGLSVKQFVRGNIPAVILVVLAYQLRTEMLLLTLPFVGLAGLFRWAAEGKILTKDNFSKYGIILGVMLFGMLLSRCIDFAAYGSEEWKDFLRFFEARTTVYDYYLQVVTQDDYSGLLSEAGVTLSQQALLRNYNFGLDESIDTELLAKTAEHAAETIGGSRDWADLFGDVLREYRYRMFRGGRDAPYNIIVLWAYAAVLLTGFLFRKEEQTKAGRYAFLWQAVLLFAVRSAVWIFIMVRGRDPERITHSLYLVEFALLAALLVQSLLKLHERKTGCGVIRGLLILFLMICAGALGAGVTDTLGNQRYRAAVNKGWEDIDEYCRSHSDNFYFEDVYSTVSFSQKIFGKIPTEPANYDIMGGWMCKSPLYHEKLAHYGISSMEEALPDSDNVFFIMSDTEMKEQGFDWIRDHYAAKNMIVAVERTDRINENYAVYRVIKREEGSQ